MKVKIVVLAVAILVSVQSVFAQGNQWNQSFKYAKVLLNRHVYMQLDERITLYCKAFFDADGTIHLPRDFRATKYVNRIQHVEWEHIVPVATLGRHLKAWQEGDELCVDADGENYAGRRCAERVSEAFRYMQADMYNLYPAIGAVNAARSDYAFALLPDAESDFGVCLVKIENNKAEPPPHARGKIARAYLYMAQTYEHFQMSFEQERLMQKWNAQYPVTADECLRTRRIEAVQGNENSIVKRPCRTMGLW